MGMLAGKGVPVDLPLPNGWREDIGPEGAKVYCNDSAGASTMDRCSNRRCRSPFVAKTDKQRTCGDRRCLWVIREEGPRRIAQKKDRFSRWYKDPEHRSLHLKATLAARRRRLAAEKLLELLAASDEGVPVPLCYSVGSVDVVAGALAALWYTNRVSVDADRVRLRPGATQRYLCLPPAKVEPPPGIGVSTQARIVSALAASRRGMTASELACSIGSDTVAVGAALLPISGLLQRFRRLKTGATSYRLTRTVLADVGVAAGTDRGEPPARMPEPSATAPDSWGLASPGYGSHLPGGGLSIWMTPRPMRIELALTRGLHGLLTNLISEPHDPSGPAWTLVPWGDGIGWGVYLRSDLHVDRLARNEFAGRLFDQRVQVRFGSRVRVRSPNPRSPGRYLLRLDAITPVCIRNSGRGGTVHLKPTAESLRSALTQAFPTRLSLAGFDPSTAALKIVAASTHAETIDCGHHLKTIRGWTGSVVVEANAVAAWLLDCAGRIGLGGRASLGFGRIQVGAATESDIASIGRDRRITVMPIAGPSSRATQARSGARVEQHEAAAG